MTENKESRAANRPTRTPLHKQSALTAEPRPGYVRRWVNDVVGRIDAYKKAGWIPVVGSSENTSSTAESQLGSVVTKVVNKDHNAPSHNAILMEIPEEWYKEDQQEKQRMVDETEASYNPEKYKQGQADYGYMTKSYK